MTAPAAFTTRRAGLRQAIVDADIVGRAVYHPAGLDTAKAPYVVLELDGQPEPEQRGDATTLAEATTGTATLYQANARDADPHLPGALWAALNGLRFLVTTGGTTFRVMVSATGPAEDSAEGLQAHTVSFVARHTPGLP